MVPIKFIEFTSDKMPKQLLLSIYKSTKAYKKSNNGSLENLFTENLTLNISQESLV